MLHIKNVEELKKDWDELLPMLCKMFDADLDLQGIIFLIGVQELGQGKQKYSKDQKQDLMHIATCRLLSIYGYYELEGTDEDGWPHWKLKQQMPKMSLGEQDYLLKNAAIEYFRDSGLF
ncbi:MAG: hypothetical protein ABI772_12205 [Bacteroidota bacterium]